VSLFTEEPREPVIDDDGAEVIPNDPVVTFLNRWLWRTENRAAVEKELRELIATPPIRQEQRG
jgi:hypothetical protein